jgi:hypothetical protein
MGRSPKTRTPGPKGRVLNYLNANIARMCGKTKDSFRYTAVRKCIPARGGAGIYACGKAAEQIGFSAEVMDSAQARKDGNSAASSSAEPQNSSLI